jgi:hypothetical protein
MKGYQGSVSVGQSDVRSVSLQSVVAVRVRSANQQCAYDLINDDNFV